MPEKRNSDFMEKARPELPNSFHKQVVDLDKKPFPVISKTGKTEDEEISKNQEEYLAEARANLAKSLDAARADYLQSGKPLLTIDELDAEIAAIRGEIK